MKQFFCSPKQTYSSFGYSILKNGLVLHLFVGKAPMSCKSVERNCVTYYEISSYNLEEAEEFRNTFLMQLCLSR